MMNAEVVSPLRGGDANEFALSDFDNDRGSKIDDGLMVTHPLAVNGNSPLLDKTTGLTIG